MSNLTMLDFPSFPNLKTDGFPRVFLHVRLGTYELIMTETTHTNNLCQTRPHKHTQRHKEEKSVHYHHRKKIIWKTFWPRKIISRPAVDSKTRSKARRPHLPPKSFLCGPPFFRQRNFLAGAGWCMLPFSLHTHTHTHTRAPIHGIACNRFVCNLFGK